MGGVRGYSSGGYNGGSANRYVGPADELTGQQQIDVGQEVDDFDDTQQVEVDHGFGKIELGSQNQLQANGQRQQTHVGQQVDDSDDTQQVEIDHGFGKIERGNRNQLQAGSQRQQIQVGQEVDDSDDTQQVEIDHGFGKIELGSQNKLQAGNQQHGQFDYTRQAGGSNVGSPSYQPNRKPFGQHSGIDGYGNSELESQSHAVNSDVTQQEYPILGYPQTNTNSRKPNIGISGNLQSQTSIGQTVDDSDLTQQTEDMTYQNPQPVYNTKPFSSSFDTGRPQVSVNHLSNFGSTGSQVHSTTKRSLIWQPEQQYIGQEIDDTDTIQSSHLNNFDSVVSQTPSTTKRSLIRQPGPQYIGQEVDDSDTTQHVSQSSDFGILGVGSLVKTSTIKPQSTVQSNFDNSRPNYENIKPISGDTDLTQQPEDNYFSNFGTTFNNNQKPAQPEEDSNLNNKKPDLNNQNTNLYHYGSGQRYRPYFRPSTPKPVSSNDFIQDEINSQTGVNPNSKPQLTNQPSNPLPTLNQVYENNRQIYGGQADTQYTSTAQHTFTNRRPWGNSGNYHGNAAETGETNPSLERHLPSTENITPKGQEEWVVGEPGYIPFIQTPKPLVTGVELGQKPLQQTNPQWVGIGSTLPQPALPVDNQVVDYDVNMPSKVNEGKNTWSTTPNTNQVNPLDLNNFPPLPTVANNARTPTIAKKPTASSFQTLNKWQTNIDEGQRRDQSLTDAEREADLLIEKLRNAQNNRETHQINTHQQTETDSYESHHGSRTYQQRTVQNSPSQGNVIQVKLENVTPEQVEVINQIEDDFTKIIDVAVQNQLKTSSTYQQTLRKLETELKTTLTDCIEGNAYSQLEVTDVDLNKYSNLILKKFDERKIPDLKKYLEIKIVKKMREQVRKAYRVDNQDVYQIQQGTRTQPDRTHYQPAAGYEVRQVTLENLTQGQFKIINQMEGDFNKQIEAAIQDHLTGASSGYLTSFENYQKLFSELEVQLKNNITECVQGATEPGLSKYSGLLASNFDQSKISKLEKYLNIKLVKNLRESLKTNFKLSASLGSNFNTDTSSYNHGYHNYQSSHHYGVQYGQTQNLNSASEKTSDIEPLEYQHATVISPPSPAYSGGVKGGKRNRPPLETPVSQTSYSNQNSQPNAEVFLENPETVEIINPDEIGEEATTEKAGWWQRFGNKVKQGASNLKKKIVGTT